MVELKKTFDIKRLREIKILRIPIIFYVVFFAFSPLIGFLFNKVFV